jgi:hypothetical protein
MNYDDERADMIWKTVLLITSVLLTAIALIALTLLIVKPKWMCVLMEFLPV